MRGLKRGVSSPVSGSMDFTAVALDTIPSSRHVWVEIDGVTVADTIRPYLLFETWLPTRYYIHPDDVDMSLLT
ncbi:MAG TPA: DUF427 domain-containing protein, partial [Anaerolineae bacterium]|nr:DUF427 domain-containing protein [Anaerolineae bacterium]